MTFALGRRPGRPGGRIVPMTGTNPGPPPGLPPAAELVDLAKAAVDQARETAPKKLTPMQLRERLRRAGRKALDPYRPQIETPVNQQSAAAALGITVEAIHQYRQRTYTDGTPQWPDPLPWSGRQPHWTYRDVIVQRAIMPGQGIGGGRPWPKKEPAS